MFKNYNDGIKLFHFDNLTKFGDIFHFITTREGGYSQAPFDSMNLAVTVGDNSETVKKNRALLASLLGISVKDFVICKQVHGNNVVAVDQKNQNSMASGRLRPVAEADAMITITPDICIMILIADCVPILLYDPLKKAIGIIHAGWRGTVKRIAEKTVEKLIEKYNCNPENIIAGIGPSIGPCCYEVGPDVIEEFEKKKNETDDIIRNRKKDGKAHLNLRLANKKQLIRAGINENNIETADLCTCCHSDMFFSYRCHGRKSGRFAAGIMIRKDYHA